MLLKLWSKHSNFVTLEFAIDWRVFILAIMNLEILSIQSRPFRPSKQHWLVAAAELPFAKNVTPSGIKVASVAAIELLLLTSEVAFTM